MPCAFILGMCCQAYYHISGGIDIRNVSTMDGIEIRRGDALCSPTMQRIDRIVGDLHQRHALISAIQNMLCHAPAAIDRQGLPGDVRCQRRG